MAGYLDVATQLGNLSLNRRCIFEDHQHRYLLNHYVISNGTVPIRILEIMWNLRDNFGSVLNGKTQADGALKKVIEFNKVFINRILNPLQYAWPVHEEYIRRMPHKIDVLFVGMNPAPKSPSGIPFGDKKEVLEFWNIDLSASQFGGIPGFMTKDKDCVSGRRLWKFIQMHFEDIEDFHEHCFVMNCTPLIFMGGKVASGNSNIALDNFGDYTTDPSEKTLVDPLVRWLMQISDEALAKAISVMNPKLIIGIGWHAHDRVKYLDVPGSFELKLITHPSPIVRLKAENGSSISNTDENWMKVVERELGDAVHSTIKNAKLEQSVCVRLCVVVYMMILQSMIYKLDHWRRSVLWTKWVWYFGVLFKTQYQINSF